MYAAAPRAAMPKSPPTLCTDTAFCAACTSCVTTDPSTFCSADVQRPAAEAASSASRWGASGVEAAGGVALRPAEEAVPWRAGWTGPRPCAGWRMRPRPTCTASASDTPPSMTGAGAGVAAAGSPPCPARHASKCLRERRVPLPTPVLLRIWLNTMSALAWRFTRVATRRASTNRSPCDDGRSTS